MTPIHLRLAASALGGSNPLARAVGANERDMRHWISGSRRCPDWLDEAVVAALACAAADHRARATECEQVARELVGMP